MHSVQWQATLRRLHSVSPCADTSPLITTLHSPWSTFAVESFGCLLRCPRDPVLIRSLRHREPLQHSFWKTKGKTNRTQTCRALTLARYSRAKILGLMRCVLVITVKTSFFCRYPSKAALCYIDLDGYFQRTRRGIICSSKALFGKTRDMFWHVRGSRQVEEKNVLDWCFRYSK